MNDQDWFEERFNMELDKWFTADIACCDECYDRFVSYWPIAYLKDVEFQSSGIDLESFYEGSRLRDEYSKDEYLQRAYDMGCPVCHEPLQTNIWPYLLPNTPTEDFEEDAEAIAAIAKRTPFLVLTHPFAEDVRNEIRSESSEPEVIGAGTRMYRGRIDNGIAAYDFENLASAPAHLCKEGRYNHAGHSVLYLASDAATCLAEVDSTGGPVAVAEFDIETDLKVLRLDLARGLYSIRNDVLGALIFSSLASKPATGTGYSKPEYVFSRFVADCCVDAGFDAISYPSTKPVSGYNLAILNPAKAKNGPIKLVAHTIVPP